MFGFIELKMFLCLINQPCEDSYLHKVDKQTKTSQYQLNCCYLGSFSLSKSRRMNKKPSDVELFNPKATEQHFTCFMNDSWTLTFSKDTYRRVCRVAWIDWLVGKRTSSKMSAHCIVYEHKKHNRN